MDDLFHIRQTLGRMVDIALQVDKCRLLLQDTVLVTLRHRVNHGLLIGVALADIHVIADTDDVCHEGDHVRGLSHRLAMRDLALLLIQVLHLKAKQIAGGAERESGSCGIIAEQGNSQPGVKDLRGDIPLSQIPERVRHGKQRHDLIICLIPGKEEIILIHVTELQCVQLVNKSL